MSQDEPTESKPSEEDIPEASTDDKIGGKEESEQQRYTEGEPPELSEEEIRSRVRFNVSVFAVATAFVVTGGLLLLGGFIAWWWHIVAPHCWRWLAPSDVSHLQATATSGAVGAVLAVLGKRVLGGR